MNGVHIHAPTGPKIRFKYLPATTPVAVGQLYRWCSGCNLVVITEILDEFHVLVKSHGYHIYGAITPSRCPRITKLRHTGTGVLRPLNSKVFTYWEPVAIK